ncbi:hypothetical protein DLJ48_03405 [Oenococcus sicerae]|uniref:Uncharacterized protein n=1 Tax=Oenococcus sicerae TaxID=2203724 RepID=A0AAJ1VQC2_9LACO|nr:hypothetical protein [Oenococcus sicerae]MDN6900022.1 hypothetical protein [Oenococcus sicerae]QAS69632.1 hypothetical protein DLJ48_03405 [Oenococcus sicerae]VDK13978.1 hypothetical protein OAL24_00778 [Oenococcus sicerae]
MKLINTSKLLTRFHKENDSMVGLSKSKVVYKRYLKKIELLVEVVKDKIYLIPINAFYVYKPVRIEVRNSPKNNRF